MQPSRLRLSLEQLEARVTPAVWGVPWPDPAHMTLSFVPDGTDISGTPSVLFQKLNVQALPVFWQQQVLAGFQTWAQYGNNVNVRVVTDGGQPLGITGAPEGDARFGDIRIAMRPLATTAIAMSQPFTWTGSTWSGDIVLNSNYGFGISGTPTFKPNSQVDLLTVMVHEMGHVFGFQDQTTDPSSVEYATYEGVHTNLSSTDVSNFQSLYGKPPPINLLGINLGGLLGGLLNTTLSAATDLVLALTQPGDLSFQASAQGSLNSSTDSHYYKIQAPSYSGISNEVMVAMVWSQDGLTRPKVDVLDAKGKPVAGAQVLANDGGTFTVQIPNAPINGAVYYLKVSNVTASSYKGPGRYFMGVNFHNSAPITLSSYSSATLTQAASMRDNNLTIGQNWLYHFSLSADTGGSAQAAEVQMYIYDSTGKQVFSMTAYAGQPPTTGIVYLVTGTYTVRFVAVPKNPGQLPPLTYQLLGEILNDPIGAQPTGSGSGSGGSGGYGGSGSYGGSWSGTGTSSTPSGGAYTYS
jgi:hypothetical protein